ncbi:MAG: NAD(P)-dependent oxidoreductase [Arenicellales bacterium]|nr:NAD(P)-dependent oxidoreductase [Arenicellales bacterium]
MAKIAFLGLGQMGSRMAANLVAAGHDVTVWNRSSNKVEPLAEKGATIAESPADAAKNADAVFSMVADDAASERVWLADDGALSAVPAQSLAIECSTISHNHVRRLADAAAAHGCSYLDCPVNGPPSAAATGDLVLLVGASQSDLERARPLLDIISNSILHFGAVGTGTAFKLINNLLGAVHVASIAEAVNLAHRLKLDAETLIAAVESGPCASPHVKRMIRPMAEGRLADQFGLAIGLREKDSRYCLAMAEAFETGMSVGEAAYQWYQLAIESVANQDDSAMLQITTAHNGMIPAR